MITVAAASAYAGDDVTLDGYDRHVRADGSFRFDPSTALDGLVHLGSWFVPAGEAAGFHGVYTQSATLEFYERTGKFPDALW